MLDLGEFLADVKARFGGRFGDMIQRMQDAINQGNIANGTDPTQMIEPPTAPNGINVSAGSDHIHVTLTDNNQRSRALHYWLEYSVNDPNFLAPHPIHLGPDRDRVIPLPAKDLSSNVYSYYFRGYAAYLSSKTASKKIVFGGSMSPTPVTLSGSSQLAFLPSTGAGTAATNGQQGGQGFGQPQFAQPRRGKPIQP
jgi:hypothetical protein